MNVIKETDNYILYTAENPYDPAKQLEYLIKNKKTKVVEIDTRVLPQALKFLNELEEALDYLKKMAVSDEFVTAESSKVIKLSKPN